MRNVLKKNQKLKNRPISNTFSTNKKKNKNNLKIILKISLKIII